MVIKKEKGGRKEENMEKGKKDEGGGRENGNSEAGIQNRVHC